MKFIDWFSGVGGFTRGMELAGHECVGHCEIDKFAEASYRSMHCITEEQRGYLATLPLKDRQKEILKEEYLNGEWYAADVSRVDARDIPSADCWCFGFPCQDISIAGKQRGFEGDRSSLFFRIMGLLKEMPEGNRPKYLFAENVKNLLSINRGFDFARILVEMAEGGYDAEWRLLNSKDYGVPQNRERVFIVGHSGRGSRGAILPLGEGDTEAAELQGHRDNKIAPALKTTVNSLESGVYPGTNGEIVKVKNHVKKVIANTLLAGDRVQVGCYPIDDGGVLRVNGFHKD